MEIVLIAFILLLGIGSVVAGRDSRIDETARRRRYLG